MSDLKPSEGFPSIEAEFESRTEKAFRAEADFIRVYSRRMRFQIEAAEYCAAKGWLTPAELVELDSQSSEWRWRLTAAGMEHWGIEAKNGK